MNPSVPERRSRARQCVAEFPARLQISLERDPAKRDYHAYPA